MYRVLVCDGDKEEMISLKNVLTAAGCEVAEAYSWEAALDASRQTEFHLVLLDRQMLPERGLVILSEIRAHSNLPVILLSERTESADMIDGLDSGAVRDVLVEVSEEGRQGRRPQGVHENHQGAA